MGKTTISWCDFTYNLWEGCFKVSPGCASCYAEAMNAWLRKGENWGRTAPRKVFKPDHYKLPYKWNARAAKEGVRFKVFVGSVMDIAEIHPVPEIAAMMDELRNDLYETILATPHLDYLFLSKRPENYERILPWGKYGEPFKNVMLGATVEDHEHAQKRYEVLMRTPAAGHFFSYEPALGPINWPLLFVGALHGLPKWIIFGTESGKKRRPADIQWARDTRDACEKYGVLWHFKQWTLDHVAGVSGERDKKGIFHLPILDGVQHAGRPK